MLLSRGIDKYGSRWFVLGGSRGILRSCKRYGSRLRSIVDVSFAPTAGGGGGAADMSTLQSRILDATAAAAGFTWIGTLSACCCRGTVCSGNVNDNKRKGTTIKVKRRDSE
jgi:hypothetical protein